MWPLDDNQLSVINENFQQLIQFLDSEDDLIFSLIATSCFTRRQISVIKCITDIEGRSSKILQLLKRRGVEHLNQFLSCLERTQRHLLPFLTGNTGMTNDLWLSSAVCVNEKSMYLVSNKIRTLLTKSRLIYASVVHIKCDFAGFHCFHVKRLGKSFTPNIVALGHVYSFVHSSGRHAGEARYLVLLDIQSRTAKTYVRWYAVIGHLYCGRVFGAVNVTLAAECKSLVAKWFSS